MTTQELRTEKGRDMSIQFSILASGSSGNSMVVDNGEARLLVDAGLSAKKIESLMSQIGSTCEELDGVLVTHEHADHIQGLGPLSRRYKLPVYANARTWAAMEKKVGDIDPDLRREFRTGEPIDFGLLRYHRMKCPMTRRSRSDSASSRETVKCV